MCECYQLHRVIGILWINEFRYNIVIIEAKSVVQNVLLSTLGNMNYELQRHMILYMPVYTEILIKI